MQKLLELASSCKYDFLAACKCFEESRVMEFIYDEMVGAVSGGDESKVRKLATALQWMDIITPVQNLFYFITLACKHKQTNILKFLSSGNIVLPTKMDDETTTFLCYKDEEGHHPVYYAIRSGHVELLDILLSMWPGIGPDELDELLSVAYENLMLKNILMSDEMQMSVQSKLIDLRFFTEGKEVQTTISREFIEQRIQLVLENISILITEYSLKKVDSKFIYIAKFIVQNAHILKQQLKSTYNVLPWEEFEFCLLSFVSAYSKPQELNLYYLSVLSKSRILEELRHFSEALLGLKKVILISNVSKLSARVRSSRAKVVELILGRSPHYQALYNDYAIIRDINSLDIIKKHIDLALLADSATRGGQLTIKRAMQVMGEHLKDTLDSPNLSKSVGDLLLLSAPQETKKVLQDLRNSLSHVNFYQHEEGSDVSSIYLNIQNDVKKIGSILTDINYSKKINVITSFSISKVTESNSLDEVVDIMFGFKTINEKDIRMFTLLTKKDHRRIDFLIEEINKIIPDKTPPEEKLINEIYETVKQTPFIKEDSLKDLKKILEVVSCIKYFWVGKKCKNIIIADFMNYRKDIFSKKSTKSTVRHFKEQGKHLWQLLTNLKKSVLVRILPKTEKELNHLITNIIINFISDKNNIKWIDEFKLQVNINNIDKIADHRNANTVEDVDITKDKKISNYLNELKEIIEIHSVYKHLPSLEQNKNQESVIEALMLDTMSLLENKYKCLSNNMLYLDDNTPLLNGRCLRNYLAHGNALIDHDISLNDSRSALLLNALKLTSQKCVFNGAKMGKMSTPDIMKLKKKFYSGLQIINKQKKMCRALTDGNIEDLKTCITEGADVHSRSGIDLSTMLHVAAQGPNVEILKFLILQQLSPDICDRNGRSVLHIAAAFGRKEIVEILVRDMAISVNRVDHDRMTPLHMAAQNGHKETVLTLISLGATKSLDNSIIFAPLFYAVANSFLELVKVLLEKQNGVDDVICGSFTSLHVAAQYGHLDLVQYLLDKSADVNAKTFTDQRPLHMAAFNDNSEVVMVLLRKGAHVNMRDLGGATPLYYAVLSDSENVARILLGQGALVNIPIRETNQTPLHAAVCNGNKIIVGLLLEKAANVNLMTFDGLTPLLCAARCDDTEILRSLINNGSFLFSKDSSGFSALHISCLHGCVDNVKFLLEMKFDVETKDSNQNTSLHIAACMGYLEIVNILIGKGAGVECINDTGLTPLHVSVSKGNIDVMQVLLDSGANANAKDYKNQTPLHGANNVNMVQLLLKNRADVNSEDMTGRTALHVASLEGNIDIVQVLIQENADIDSKTTNGDTPLHLAVIANKKAVIRVLIAYGANVNSLNKTGLSALFHAANYSDSEILDLLIDKGAHINISPGNPLIHATIIENRLIVESLLKNVDIDISVRDHTNQDMTLLHLAALSGNCTIGRLLLRKGMKVEPDFENYKTPLLVAVSNGRKEFVNLLLENGAKVNGVLPGVTTPLHAAVIANQPIILENLLRHGAKLDPRDKNDKTPLQLAVAHSFLQSIKILFEYQGLQIKHSIRKSDCPLLHIAAKAGNLEIIKYLIDKGEDLYAMNVHGARAIHIAAKEGNKDLIELFMEYGMTIKDLDASERTLLHYAAEGGKVTVINYLVRNHLNINAVDINGMHPIHLSAIEENKEMVKTLLCSGAMYDAVDKHGRTPISLTMSVDIKEMLMSIENLFEAVKKNDAQKVLSLVKDSENFVDVKSVINASLLHLASWKGFEEVCGILIKNKANPNATGREELTPLHYASKFSRFEIVLALLKAGAIYNSVANNGKVPMDYATKGNIIYVLKLVDDSFNKAEQCNVEVIEDLRMIKDFEITKAVLRARNTDENTLEVMAQKNGFFEVFKIKSNLQGHYRISLEQADSFLESRNFSKAERIYKDVLNDKIEMFGENDPTIQEIITKIAAALAAQKKFPEALSLFKEIGEKQNILFGANSLECLCARGNIAEMLHFSGRAQESFDIFQDVINKLKNVFGEGHTTLIEIKYMATSAFRKVGKNEEALKILREAHKHFQKTYGEHNLKTCQVVDEITDTLLCLGHNSEALRILQKEYKLRKIVLGKHHTMTLKTRLKMGGALLQQKEYDEALEIFRSILAVQKSVLGANHLDTLFTQINILSVLLSQNKTFDALKMHKEISDNRVVFSEIDYPNLFCHDTTIKTIKENSIAEHFDRTFDDFFPKSRDLELVIAANKGDTSLVETLLQNGSNMNTSDSEGRTPLHFAASGEHSDIVSLLLKSGADATAVSAKGNTPLHIASSRDCKAIVQILLQNVRDIKPSAYDSFINAKTSIQGVTALHIAAKRGSLNIVKCLLEHGAIYNSPDRTQGLIPLQCSQSEAVIQILEMTGELFDYAERGDIWKLRAENKGDLVTALHARDMQHRTPKQVAQLHQHKNFITFLNGIMEKSLV